MTVGEKIGLVVSLTSIIVGAIVSIITICHFNNKGQIYEIKKNVILRSMRLIDDYASSAYWVEEKNQPVVKGEVDSTYLTIEARECYNELILTVRNPKLISVFKQIIFPNLHNTEGKFNSVKIQEFRILCRKELGIRKCDFDNEISFIFEVGSLREGDN